MFEYFNPNPTGRSVGDCTVRAISKATGKPWETVYADLCLQGFELGDMPSANAVWGAYLHGLGWTRQIVPSDCPDCYTVADFARDHPRGTFILALSGHVVCLHGGVIFDTWDSTSKIPLYFWKRSDEE